MALPLSRSVSLWDRFVLYLHRALKTSHRPTPSLSFSAMVRLTADLILISPQYFNAVREREIDLRGKLSGSLSGFGVLSRFHPLLLDRETCSVSWTRSWFWTGRATACSALLSFCIFGSIPCSLQWERNCSNRFILPIHRNESICWEIVWSRFMLWFHRT